MDLKESGGHGRSWEKVCVWGELYNYILILKIGQKKTRKFCSDMNKPKDILHNDINQAQT